MRTWKKTLTGIISIAIIILTTHTVYSQTVHHSGLPKTDTIYYKAYPGAPPEVIVQEFLDCETDWIEGPGRSDLYTSVVNAGHNVSIMNNISEFIFFPINNRDYKQTSGDPNAPLNDSNWRLALSYVYGMDDKEADIFGYYGVPWYSAHGNPMPPAQQPWYDAATWMPNTDYDEAWNILSAAGYYVHPIYNWLCYPGPPETHNILIEDFSFYPQNLPISKGDTVVWTNNDPVVHTLWFVYAENKSTYLMSDPLLPGDSWSHVFDDLTNLRCYCFKHLWINGSLSVGVLDLVRPPDGPNNGKITFLYPTGAIVYPNGPGGGMVRNWNGFITDYLGAEGPLMEITPTDYTTLLDELYAVRDYDIIGIESGNLGRYADWLCEWCHSSNDMPWPWGSNFCGIHDSDYDRWTEIILTSMNPAEIQQACENLTRKFVNEGMNWMPAITSLDFSTTKVNSNTDFLSNLIPMELYGSRNSYSWMCMHWYGTPDVVWPGGSYAVALGDEPDTLNPWTEYSPYGWDTMERSILTEETGLIGVNPETLKNTPFVATKWRVMNWTNIPELGIEEGATAQFYLRQDVVWQDWETSTLNDRLDPSHFSPNPVDAYDCVANMRFMRYRQPGMYSSTWAHLVYEEADGPFKFNVYFDQTSLYYSNYVSDVALLVPEHIIDALDSQSIDWETWEPCAGGRDECTYDDLTGDPCSVDYPWMKQLVGCGPYVFRYYDRSLAVGQVEKFNEFFINAPVIGSVYGEWRVDPSDDYTYQVLIHNIGAKTHDNYGSLTNAVVDVAIYEDDVLAYVVNDTNLASWEHTYLGPYTKTDVTCGPHIIKVVVTGNTFRHEYEHLYVATLRYDISTYSGSGLDFSVNMMDIARAAKAFGSGPGHLRWDPPCDVNDDFYVDMVDIATVAKYFGWSC